jgi:hypothetical protein
MKIWEQLKNIRRQLTASFNHSIYDAAKFNGLAIEYWDGMPAHFNGRLDTTNEVPRFIAVNSDLPRREQTYVIAREIARFWQQRQSDSLVFNRPWKRELLATAPAETRSLIYRLDLEWRTYLIMYWHARKDDFFGFYNHNWGKYSLISNASNTSEWIFFKLRVRNFFQRIFSALRLGNEKPTSQVS